MIIRRLGRADYEPTWRAMREFTRDRSAETPDELWLVEHPPVFTLGQAGRREHLLAPTDIPVVTTDRGGQITYHGPGQVVAYPLLDLRRLAIFAKELVFRIEQAVIQTLDSFGVDGRRVAGAPGIFVPWETNTSVQFAGLAKIAAIGIKITRSRSYHGVALNVAMDRTPYSLIDSCGYPGLVTVDLAALGVPVDWASVADRLAERLQAHLSPALETEHAPLNSVHD